MRKAVRLILESTFIIDFLRGRSGTAEKMAELEESGLPIYTTSITVFEVIQGTRGNKEEMAAARFFSAIQVIPLTKRSAMLPGKIRRLLLGRGRTIEPEDAMIAGISVLKQETLLTRNLKHFSAIEGLKTETY